VADDIEKLGVFQVFTGVGTGSSFLIDARHLVTNCHVVAPYRKVGVELRDKRRVVGTVRRIHPSRDLALVEVDAPLDEQVLALSPATALHAEQPVRILGFPVGLPLSVTEGVVSNPRQLFGDQHFVQTDAAVNPGNSGGPMLDEATEVVAVTSCKLIGADMVGFGIPGADVRQFIDGFHDQTAPFGVVCPACDVLLESSERYCDGCGSDLEGLDLGVYFEPQIAHPLVAFVERGLAAAGMDPVLARHGEQNWSFYWGSAPIKVASFDPEHLCFTSPLAKVGKQRLDELLRFLLAPEHAPFFFLLDDNTIYLSLTFHTSDVFSSVCHDEAPGWIAKFVDAADRFDNLLIEQYGCEPAPETQLEFLEVESRK
jgi:serine protease Do